MEMLLQSNLKLYAKWRIFRSSMIML